MYVERLRGLSLFNLTFRKKIKGNPSAVFKNLEKSEPSSSQIITTKGQKTTDMLQKVKLKLL